MKGYEGMTDEEFIAAVDLDIMLAENGVTDE